MRTAARPIAVLCVAIAVGSIGSLPLRGAAAGPDLNVAAAANGAAATASSYYSAGSAPSAAIDGNRRGDMWGAGGGWNDGTSDQGPDWLQINFAGAQTIGEVDVFSVQDAYTAPVDPTPTQTFALYGVTDFEVQYWDGAQWLVVPNGTITGNTLVWRQITFPALTTIAIRIWVTGALAHWSRVVEVEAYPATTNVAAAANGATATASSYYSAGAAPSAAIDGNRRGDGWGAGGGWNDGTSDQWPDCLQINFAGARTIGEVDVFSVQDLYTAPVDPTPGLAFTLYGISDFEVQYWDGAQWLVVPNGTITGNTLVWRRITFPALTTMAIRIWVTGALAHWSRVVEVEAYPATNNVAAAANGATATASSYYSAGSAPGAAIDGNLRGDGWGAGGGWNDGTSDQWPDWLRINFAGAQTIGEVDVYLVQDAYTAPVDPTPTQTFALYGVTDFEVQYWDGAQWLVVPNGTITGNTLVWRRITFPALTTMAIRIWVTGALAHWSRVVEVEAYPASAPMPAPFAKSAPANATLGQPLTPTLSWTASAGATGYDVCIDTTFDGSCTGSWINVGSATSVPAPPLAPNTWYQWQVRAHNNAGITEANAGTWWNFTTTPTPAYALHGLGFSPYVDGQDPNFGTQISAAQIQARLQIIAPYTHWVRSFGSTHGLEQIPALAHSFGLQMAAGAWIGRDLAQNDLEISNLIANCLAGHVDLAIVGSEALLRGDVSEAQLIAYINQVRQAIPSGIPVATADTFNVLLAHPAVIAAGDVVLPNIYGYWQGLALSNAICALDDAYNQVVAASGGRPVVMSETGWPSAGPPKGSAVPSPANAASYFIQFVSWARAHSVPYFYFSALDESWKAAHEEGPVGAHWGVWDKDGALKPGMQPVFDDQTLSMSCIPGGPGVPDVHFTYVPPYGALSADRLEGAVLHVATSDYKVALYILVGNGWWTKPTFVSPLTTIQPDGSWTATIVTGGNDAIATQIAAFLIPNAYSPPALGGAGALPAELFANAVATAMVTRTPNSVSGRILDAAGNPLGGVTVSLSGGNSGTTTTAPDGKYSFPNLPGAGITTVTPSMSGYSFNPISQPVVVFGNVVVNFTGTQPLVQHFSPGAAVTEFNPEDTPFPLPPWIALADRLRNSGRVLTR